MNPSLERAGGVADGEVCCFGKLPLHGDFIRVRRDAPEIDRLDLWMQDGIARSRARRADGWDRAFDERGVAGFAYACPETGGLLVGAVRASQDAAGRRYPFLVAARSARAGDAGAIARRLAALASFVDEAAAFARDGWRDTTVADLPRSLPHARTEPDAFDALRRDAAALHWDAAGIAVGRRSVLLHALSELVAPAAPPRFVLHLPSGAGARGASLWLSILAGLAPHAVPTLAAWRDTEVGGRLSLAFGSLLARSFDPMWWPEVDDEHGWTVDASANDADRRERADRQFGAAAAAATVGELLDRLRAV